MSGSKNAIHIRISSRDLERLDTLGEDWRCQRPETLHRLLDLAFGEDEDKKERETRTLLARGLSLASAGMELPDDPNDLLRRTSKGASSPSRNEVGVGAGPRTETPLEALEALYGKKAVEEAQLRLLLREIKKEGGES